MSGELVVQLVGLPAPPGAAVVIPKYRLCGEPTPWGGRGWRLCRFIEEYGPLGVDAAARRLGLRLTYDPAYGAPMPYAPLESLDIACPTSALADALASGAAEVVAAVGELASRIGVERLGLTGSQSIRAAAPGVSDVDLIVYGEPGEGVAEEALRVFQANPPAGTPRGSFGGLRVEPPLNVGWRRAVIAGVAASWTAAPARGVAAHCEPLRRYPPGDPPSRRIVRVEVNVRPGQEEALFYPPCVEANGAILVSLEYNVGLQLFRGGRLKVEGVASHSGGAVYLGLREYPGTLKVL